MKELAAATSTGTQQSQAATTTSTKNKKTKSVERMNTKKSLKRTRRGDKDKPEVINDEQSYRNRLLHKCHKELHKQAKVCRNFECQKMIRKLKQQKQEATGAEITDKPSTVAEEKDKRREDEIARLRHLPLEPIVQECYRRLGILDLLSQEQQQQQQLPSVATTTAPAGGDGHDSTQNEEKDLQKLIERILQHKKMREALETWSVEITVYRKWCAARERQQDGDDDDDAEKTTRQKKRKIKSNKAKNESAVDDLAYQAATTNQSLFVQLNHDADDDTDSNGEDDDDGSDGERQGKVKSKKKNRAGQKARRAKLEEFNRANGLPPPPQRNSRKTSRQSDHPSSTKANDAAALSKEELHPSWEARKSQSSTIVAFQGKKILFDSTVPNSYTRPPKEPAASASTNTPPAPEGLHPSWEARKTQTSSIVAFQGKKITF